MNYKRNPTNIEPYVIYPENKTRIQRIIDFHGGTIRTADFQEMSVLLDLEQMMRGESFHWEVETHLDKKTLKPYVTATFGGRTTTDTALTKKGNDRNYKLAEQLGGWEYSQFDIRAEVPSVYYLLFQGKWLGTDPKIHLRKDIMRKIGVQKENDDDKTCTFRWLFEPSLAKAKANFNSAVEGRGSRTFDFSLDEEQFIKGWVLMQNQLFCSNTPAEWDNNVVADWKQSIWWWCGRLEEITKQLLNGEDYKVCNAFDCFYSDADVDVIKSSIDNAAIMVRDEYLDERKLFIEKWGAYSPYEYFSTGRKNTKKHCPLAGSSSVGMTDKSLVRGAVGHSTRTHLPDTTERRSRPAYRPSLPIQVKGIEYRNRREACEKLDISQKTLYRKLQKEKKHDQKK
ncbi:hypothetical protein AGMMS50212_08870 [Spirochaetia bacterium]|nr:hypothetical protein AGMMS50212_08870 [Spirochaetia bacterium]